jgi:hypothetical protein
MAPPPERDPFVLSVTETLNEILQEQLPQLWAPQNRPAKFFENGVNWISVSVKAGLVEVSLSVGGKAAPPAAGQASQKIGLSE